MANTVDVQHEIISELFTMHQSDDESFESYKARVDTWNDRLARAKVDLPSALYRFIVLKKLRAECQQIVVAIELNSEYKDTEDGVALWSKITLAITRFERTTLNQGSAASEGGSAMAARGVKSNQQSTADKKRDRRKVLCFGCKEYGHYRSECPRSNKKRENDDQVSEESGHAKIASTPMSSSANGVSESDKSSQYLFSAVAIRSRPLYSEIVCAGMSAVKRSKEPSVSVASPAATAMEPKPLRRLIRPGSTEKPNVKVPVPVLPMAQGRAPLQQVVRNVPGKASQPKSSKPIEMRLKQMTWGIDTMASVHCSGNKAVFASRRRCTPMRILCANDEAVIADQIGTVRLRLRSETGNIVNMAITDVYYCSELGANLLSCVKLYKTQGASFVLNSGESTLLTERGTRVPLTTRGNLLTIEGDAPAVVYQASVGLVIQTVDELVAAHARLGHIGFDRLIDILKGGKTRGIGRLRMSVEDIQKARAKVIDCVACRKGKGTNTPHSGNGTLNHGTAPGEVLHFDTFEVRQHDGPTQYGVAIADPYSGALYCPRVMSKDKIAAEVIKVIESTVTMTRISQVSLH